ncbi:hypothetical protein GGR50DRAFT_653554 [Xylaria sp. CBS 124048]|nr:hypothetical protein GGR50DRAFT_653554 [Xylaria sp. CBS 124048]
MYLPTLLLAVLGLSIPMYGRRCERLVARDPYLFFYPLNILYSSSTIRVPNRLPLYHMSRSGLHEKCSCVCWQPYQCINQSQFRNNPALVPEHGEVSHCIPRCQIPIVSAGMHVSRTTSHLVAPMSNSLRLGSS